MLWPPRSCGATKRPGELWELDCRIYTTYRPCARKPPRTEIGLGVRPMWPIHATCPWTIFGDGRRPRVRPRVSPASMPHSLRKR